MLRATGHIFLGLGPRQNVDCDTPQREEKETKATYDQPPAIMFWPAATLLGLVLAVGLWPGLLEQAELAARRFQDRPAYCAAVLEGLVAPTTSNSPVPHRAARPGVLWGLGAAAGAVFLAAAALFPESFKIVYRVAILGTPLLAVCAVCIAVSWPITFSGSSLASRRWAGVWRGFSTRDLCREDGRNLPSRHGTFYKGVMIWEQVATDLLDDCARHPP